jgi:hypothetical protein
MEGSMLSFKTVNDGPDEYHCEDCEYFNCMSFECKPPRGRAKRVFRIQSACKEHFRLDVPGRRVQEANILEQLDSKSEQCHSCKGECNHGCDDCRCKGK